MDRSTIIKGPDFEVKHSVLDAKFVGLYSRRLFIFRPATYDKHRIAQALEKGVRRLVQHVPALGGTIEDTGLYNGQKGWHWTVNGPGIELVTKEVDLDLSALERVGYPPSELLDNALFSSISPDIAKPPYPACKIQVNLAKNGALLAFSVAHVVADGPGISTIVCYLAEHCRAVQEKTSGLPPITPAGLDRACYIDLKSNLDNVRLEDHAAYGETAAPLGSKDTAHTNGVPAHDILVKMYKVSEQSLNDLKTAATTVRISTHDAISAVIWRGTIFNRIEAGIITFDEAAETHFYVPVSTRRYMGCGEDFIGNAVYQACATTTIGKLLSAEGLATAAAAIRTTINNVTRDSIAGLVQLHQTLPCIRDIGWKAHERLLTWDCAASSFYHSEEMYTADWGRVFGGKAVCMRCSNIGFLGNVKGAHYVMPRVVGDGRGVEVQMSVERAGMAAMEGEEVFGRYFKDIGKVE